MSGKTMELSEENNIAVITFNNPPVNILDAAAMSELDETFHMLAQKDDVRAIVFISSAPVFIAGVNIQDIAQISSAQKGEQLARRGQVLFSFIEDMKKPVIAAINGRCLGGGMEFVMSCHMRIASERAQFGQPEINLGVIPGFGGTQRLTRIVGPSRATEIILSGNMVSATEAERIGLVNRVVPEGELLKYAKGIAGIIAQKGRLAIAAAMTSIGMAISTGGEEGFKLEASEFGKLCGTKDMQEGIRAFMEKRQPKFN